MLTINDDAEEDEVLAYLQHRVEHCQVVGLKTADPAWFWRPGDLEHYHAASAWWPKDAPGLLACPPLGLLLDGIGTVPQLENQTFYQRLSDAAAKTRLWLELEDRNLEHPNETADERRRRKGREAVARHRAFNRSGDPRGAELRRLYAAWLEACVERKRAVAEVEAVHDPLVEAAHTAWLAFKNGEGAAPEDAAPKVPAVPED